MARKILLADDSVTAQNMGRKILADAGYEVVTVNNGSAALKKIAELKPDLVILDVYMPGYSGLEVCQRLKESQDSSRIPVLLTVGKLEPFKPEEAQRVRAEGFIVKPFEASELLSALSKLEDKVVPRAEPSKPGRFARAIAAQEESSRGNHSDQNSEDNGWKSRLGFPHAKTEPEEKVADDSSIYNAINRDLRTVVETPEERKQHDHGEPPTPQTAGKGEATSVDIAALAPAGLPKDVTPEEIAAIAAAAAQLQAIQEKHQVPEAAAPEAPKQVEAVGSAGAESVDPSTSVKPEGNSDLVAANVAPEPVAAVLPVESSNTDNQREPEQEAPVTMAGNTGAGIAENQETSRWQAVAVALEADEAAISLDQEMQKAYAAFVAEETASREAASSVRPAIQSRVAENSNSHAVPESPAVSAVAVAEIESETASVREADLPVAATASEPAHILQPSSSVPTEAAAETDPVKAYVAESQPTEAADEEPAVLAQRACDLAQQELSRQVARAAVEGAAAAPETPQSIAPASSPETLIAESTATPHPFAAIVRAEETKAEEKAEDPEEIKNTAAAWASWRQIRDTGDGRSVEARQPESEAPVPASEESAAMAVAAGAEQAVHDAVTSKEENPTDIASIVDSVLANLRPKLMAEISKKMAEKK